MFVYILQSPNCPGLYTGITRDPAMRLARHNEGTGAKYTRGRGPWAIVYLETARDRFSAAKREREIKTWSRAAKLALIRHYADVERKPT